MTAQQLEKAEKQIKTAWVTGCISAALTLAATIAGFLNEDIRYKTGYDIWHLFDVALIAGLTYGIYRQKRYSALGLLIYFIVSKLISAFSQGQHPGGFLAIIFIIIYFQGTRAAFQLYKHRLETGEIVKPEKRRGFGFYLTVAAGSVFVILLSVFIFFAASTPEVEVIPGKQINKKYLSFVRQQGLIEPIEEIQYWYSDGFGDFKKGFYLFTDKKVIIYNQNWEEPAILIPYDQIADIEFDRETSFFEDSRITIYLKDKSSIFFPVSSDNDGDQKYYNRLIEMWNQHPESSEPAPEVIETSF